MTLANKIIFAIVTAVTGSVASKALHNTWTRVTGDEPPNLADPEVPAHRALAWVVLSGLMIAGTQIFLNRLGTNRWHAKSKPIAVRIGK